MDFPNFFIALGILSGLICISYHLGIKKGRKVADQILGENHREALRRIKRQSDRNQ